MLKTYTNQHPSLIRSGDVVQDAKGTYTAHSDAAIDQWGDWNVLDDSGRYRSYGESVLLTVTIEEIEDSEAW